MTARAENTSLNTRVTRTDLMLLGLLAGHPMHGYELAERLSDPKMTAWVKLGRTSIYYALGRLQKHGLVSSHSERQGGKPERNVYAVTDAGRSAFVAGLQEALSSTEPRTDDFDIALFFSNRLDGARTREHVEQRLTSLEQQVQSLGALTTETDGGEERELMLVLEHRMAVLRADIDFLSGYVGMLRSGKPSASISGSIEDTVLAEVLWSLAAAGRTGVLTVRTTGSEVGFCYDHGRFYGLLASGQDVTDALKSVFGTARGTFEFTESTALEASALDAGDLTQAILTGARGTTERRLLERMNPSADTILDVVDGVERDIIGVDLTDDERHLLMSFDGVRTVAEIARASKWSADKVREVAYPLWLSGWLVLTDRSKRLLVVSTASLVRRWSEAVSMFAGASGHAKVFQDVETAAESVGTMSFQDLDRKFEEQRIRGTTSELAASARDYVDLLERVITTRLGRGFYEDASIRFVRQLPDETLDALAANGIISG